VACIKVLCINTDSLTHFFIFYVYAFRPC
jgi:hypothetical protein